MFSKIFFSYARADGADFALRLAVDLKKEGFNVWIDQQDIRAGSEWDLEIEKALENCDCLLFIETEKSVTSNNVLDEVYYALDEHKKVIPVIYHDSKTPYRLKRLQHVDFTIDYEKGLMNLIKELKRTPTTEASKFPETADKKQVFKPFLKKSHLLLLTAAFLVILTAAFIIYSTKDKTDPVNINEETALKQTNDTFINDEGTNAIGEKKVDDKSGADKERSQDIIEAGKRKLKTTTGTNRKPNKPVEKNATAKTEDTNLNLHEIFAGNWKLSDVQPKTRLKSGWLKIEETDGQKVKIQSGFQFYYIQTNDTAFLNVFNGFARCNACILKDGMRITDNDIAIGTQTYRILKEPVTGEGNAGDTTMSAGGNSTLHDAVVTMHFVDNKTIEIKVQLRQAVTMSFGFVMQPFLYRFRFTNND